MATKTIAWPTGGNITLSYDGQGNGTIVVTSDDNPTDAARSKTITVTTSVGSVSRQVTINQGAGPNFRLKDGKAFIPKGSDFFNVKS